MQLTSLWPGWPIVRADPHAKNIGFKLKIESSTALAHYPINLLKIQTCAYEKHLPHLTSKETVRFSAARSLSPRAVSMREHLYVLNRNRRRKITPAGSESHADISFFLSSQPLPRSLHSYQIFFNSGGEAGREAEQCWPTLNADTLRPAETPIFNFTHSRMCTWHLLLSSLWIQGGAPCSPSQFNHPLFALQEPKIRILLECNSRPILRWSQTIDNMTYCWTCS